MLQLFFCFAVVAAVFVLFWWGVCVFCVHAFLRVMLFFPLLSKLKISQKCWKIWPTFHKDTDAVMSPSHSISTQPTRLINSSGYSNFCTDSARMIFCLQLQGEVLYVNACGSSIQDVCLSVSLHPWWDHRVGGFSYSCQTWVQKLHVFNAEPSVFTTDHWSSPCEISVCYCDLALVVNQRHHDFQTHPEYLYISTSTSKNLIRSSCLICCVCVCVCAVSYTHLTLPTSDGV